MTLQEVIDRLPKSDCRKDFWIGIQNQIKTNQFDLVLEKIRFHNDDVDYTEQVKIVTQAIRQQLLQSDAVLNTIDQSWGD